MASRIPALPRDSHVPSHAAVHKNKLCDFHAPLVARAIAGGWTRPATGEWPLSRLWIARISAIYLLGLIEAAGEGSEKDIARPVHF
jgi:hypothetical protein